LGIEFPIGARDDVAGNACLDSRRIAHDSSQPRDVLVHHVLGTARWHVAPDAVDQALDRHHLPLVEQENAEQRAFPSPKGDDALVNLGLERAKDAEDGVHRFTEDRRSAYPPPNDGEDPSRLSEPETRGAESPWSGAERPWSRPPAHSNGRERRAGKAGRRREEMRDAPRWPR